MVSSLLASLFLICMCFSACLCACVFVQAALDLITKRLARFCESTFAAPPDVLRVLSLSAKYFVDLRGQLWLCELEDVLTQVVLPKMDVRLVMSKKLATNVAKAVRACACRLRVCACVCVCARAVFSV